METSDYIDRALNFTELLEFLHNDSSWAGNISYGLWMHGIDGVTITRDGVPYQVTKFDGDYYVS